MKETKISIIGFGWVGKAMYDLFPGVIVYDPVLVGRELLDGNRIIDDKKAVNQTSFAFVCVPTPNVGKGKLDTSIVEEVISWCEADVIIVRSTVNPGDCDRWTKKYNKRIVMQPEYLGETVAHPLLDPTQRQFLILGGDKQDTHECIKLYQMVYNANITIRQTTRLEAEIIKISENRAIFFKVSQCQELFDVCHKQGVDYNTIREAVYGDDPRFNLWWTFVFPDERGANSKCIPKDVYAWRAWAESLGYDPKVTNAMLDKNEEWISQS